MAVTSEGLQSPAPTLKDQLLRELGQDVGAQAGCNEHRGRGVEIENVVPPRGTEPDVTRFVPSLFIDRVDGLEGRLDTDDGALEKNLVRQQISEGDVPRCSVLRFGREEVGKRKTQQQKANVKLPAGGLFCVSSNYEGWREGLPCLCWRTTA